MIYDAWCFINTAVRCAQEVSAIKHRACFCLLCFGRLLVMPFRLLHNQGVLALSPRDLEAVFAVDELPRAAQRRFPHLEKHAHGSFFR